MWGYVLIPAGVAVLMLAWLRRDRCWPLVFTGWGLVVGGITGLAITGADRAAAFGILIFVGAGLVAVAARAVRQNTRPHRCRPRREQSVRAAAAIRMPRLNAAGFATFGVAVPLAGVAAFLAAAIIGRAGVAAGLHPANGVVVAFALTPLVWAGLSTIVLMRPDQRPAQALVLAGTSVIAAVFIVF